MKYFFIILCIISLSISCKKDSGNSSLALPPATQEGKNTFGCIVNGSVWLPELPIGYFGGIPRIYASYYKGKLTIGANKYKDPDNWQSIYFYIYNNSKGKFILKKSDLTNKTNGVIFGYNHCDLETDSIQSGIIEITRFDTLNHIFSGTFSFEIKNNCGSVKVTDGRFDL